MESFIIGIAGGTGSGKTTLTKRLKERFGDDVSVISHDNYYKRHDELPYEERCRLNYDHPDAFDTDLMVEQVQACLLYTSDAADDLLCVDFGGRRIIKKTKTVPKYYRPPHGYTYYTSVTNKP